MHACSDPPKKEPTSTLLGLPAGPDLEKAGVGEVDADESQLPGAHPAGIVSQLSWELHGLGLWRARNRLHLVPEASRPTTTPSLLPPPQEALPALPRASPTLEPPPTEPSPARLHLHPNFPRSQAFPSGCSGLEFGLFIPLSWGPEDGASSPSTQVFSRDHTRALKGVPFPWPLPRLPHPRNLQKQEEDTAPEGPQAPPFHHSHEERQPHFTEAAAHSY